MVVSASHFKDVTNGYEKRTDGLWVHQGRLAVGPPGTRGQAGDLSVNRGNNTGTVYFGSGDTYMYFTGTAFAFNPPLTGSAIADGSIGTADLAAGAAQALIGTYMATPTWSTTAVTTWLATPVQVTCTTTVGLLRIEVHTIFQHSVANAAVIYGIGVNGASPSIWWYAQTPSAPNSLVNVSGVYYATVGAATHTLYLSAYNATAGTLGQYGAGYHTMYVTEQRR